MYFKWRLKVRGYHLTLCFSVNNKDLLGTNKQTINQSNNNNKTSFHLNILPESDVKNAGGGISL